MELEKSSMHCFLSSLTSLRHTANNKLHQNSIYTKRESGDEVGEVKYALFLIFAHFTQTHCKQQTASKFNLQKTVVQVKYALFLIFAHFTQTHCKQQTTSKFNLHKTREW